MELSIVVPLYNERDNLVPLHEELARVLGSAASYEMLFIDDGSTDGSADVLRTIKAGDTHVRVFRLARNSGQTAALTVIPGIVFSGGQDGVLRAFAAADGRQVWEFDTVRDFMTANGVAARGGAMGAPGPIVAGGMLFLGSGYTGLGNGRGGNVLLAFETDESRSTR